MSDNLRWPRLSNLEQARYQQNNCVGREKHDKHNPKIVDVSFIAP
jgi:hypothetical protein